MICKFCRFKTDEEIEICPKCGATMIKIEQPTIEPVEPVIEPPVQQPVVNQIPTNTKKKSSGAAILVVIIIIFAVVVGVAIVSEKNKEDAKIPANTTTQQNAKFLMTITDKFSSAEKGTVVTGKIERGSIKVNDEVEIIGNGKNIKAKVGTIEKFRKQLEEASAGETVGISFKDLELSDVEVGQSIVK